MTDTNQKRLDAEALRRMYEYYVKVPRRFWNPAHLGILRWLLGRREPAQTMGWPVVKTEIVTSSERYGSVDLGPTEDDSLGFDDLESLSERDCAGLVGWEGLVPRGIWMVTNIKSPYLQRDDLWGDTFAAILKPSMIFAYTEEEGNLWDRVGMTQLYPGDPAPDHYRVHCSGLLVGDRKDKPDKSEVKLNILRGVEITASTQYFWTNPGESEQPIWLHELLDLGTDQTAAILHVFRLAALPPTGETRVLFRCVPECIGNTNGLPRQELT